MQSAQWDSLSSPAQVSSPTVAKFMAILAGTLAVEKLQILAKAIQANTTARTGDIHAEQDDSGSLYALVARCSSNAKRDSVSDFWSMIDMIRLACKVSR